MKSRFPWSWKCSDLRTVVSEMQSRFWFRYFCVPVFWIYFLVWIVRFFGAMAVSGTGIGTQSFGTWTRDCNGTRFASVIVVKLIRNSIKGKKKSLNFFFLWKACFRYYQYIVAFYIMSASIQLGYPMWDWRLGRSGTLRKRIESSSTDLLVCSKWSISACLGLKPATSHQPSETWLKHASKLLDI